MDDSLDRVVRAALEEDIGPGDVTTQAIMPGDVGGHADIVAKSSLIAAGLNVAERAFSLQDPRLAVTLHVRRGEAVPAGALIASISGPVRSILAAERTALNFLGRLSGIATLTRRFVDALDGTAVQLLDTRKTTPGLRRLEKNAVRAGGGSNHRFGLFDGILVKDNHIIAAGSITEAVRRVRAAPRIAGHRIEVEVTTRAELEEAIQAGADLLLLDNMTIAALADAVAVTAGRALLEASGNVTLATLGDIAATGVHYISAGAITHSAPAADVSLRLRPPTPA